MKPLSRLACLAVMALGPSALVDCEALGSGVLGGVSTAACPELGVNVNAAGAVYTSRADFNAKIGAFVVATKDLMSIAAQAEAETAQACVRIGHDIGLAWRLQRRRGSGTDQSRRRARCGVLPGRRCNEGEKSGSGYGRQHCVAKSRHVKSPERNPDADPVPTATTLGAVAA